MDNLKIFLGDELTTGIQAEFVPAGTWKYDGSNIKAKVVGLEAIVDFNRRQFTLADKLILVQVDQFNLELIGPLGIGETKIDSHLWVLAGKGFGPKMSEGPDDTFFPGEAVDDDGVTDEESLNARL